MCSRENKMGKATVTICTALIGLLVSTHHAECVSTSTAAQTTPSVATGSVATSQSTAVTTQTSSQTSPEVTTPGNAQTTTTESIRDFIRRLIQQGIRDGMKTLINAVIPKTDVTTEAPGTTTESTSSSTSQATTSSEMTSSSQTSTDVSTSTVSSSTTAGRPVTTCPEGLYDQTSNTVTFAMEDRDCQITVYLAKPPKAGKQKKEKRGKTGKRKHGKDREPSNQDREQSKERFLEKNISVRPIRGIEADQCPEVTAQQHGKDGFLAQTSECIMYVKKTKKSGKGKDRSSRPLILTQPVGQ